MRLDADVDVLAQQQTSRATGEVAEAAGLKWVEYNDDLQSLAPNACLTGPVREWGPFGVAIAPAIIDGTWKPDQ
jgi:basic membrane lipoprotein Med (substrate-binding protein (PBP1-ABC) superfamily)